MQDWWTKCLVLFKPDPMPGQQGAEGAVGLIVKNSQLEETSIELGEHARFTPQFPIPDDVNHLFRARYSHVQYVWTAASPIACSGL